MISIHLFNMPANEFNKRMHNVCYIQALLKRDYQYREYSISNEMTYILINVYKSKHIFHIAVFMFKI